MSFSQRWSLNFALLAASLPLFAAEEPRRCWTLDASDPANHADEVLVTTLQGIVNRDRPRLVDGRVGSEPRNWRMAC